MRCSQCGETGTIREIVYGLPAPDFDFKRYASGGCCVILGGPNVACSECGWEGFLDPDRIIEIRQYPWVSS